MIKNLVTVMIPCFNGEQYLPKCLNCILEQDYKEIQLIVINDGSTDKSENIILEFKERIESKGYEFLYLKQDNQGAAQAINNGLKYVNGEFLMLYDVDDILYSNNISKKAEYLNKHQSCGIVINDGYFLYEKSREKKLFCSDEVYIKQEGLFNALIYEHAYNWPGSYMIRTEMLFSKLKDREIYVSAYGQNLQVLLPTAYFYECGILKEQLMEYLVRENSVSHTQDIMRQLELQKGFAENRIGTIKQMPIQKEEKSAIIQEVTKWNNRKCFIFAFNNNIRDEMKRTKRELKNSNDFGIKDMVRYIVGHNIHFRKIYQSVHNIKAGRKYNDRY